MADREPYKDWSFFAVFDGHAGNVAADDAAENIMKTLMETPQFEKVGVLCLSSYYPQFIGISDYTQDWFLKWQDAVIVTCTWIA